MIFLMTFLLIDLTLAILIIRSFSPFYLLFGLLRLNIGETFLTVLYIFILTIHPVKFPCEFIIANSRELFTISFHPLQSILYFFGTDEICLR